MNRRDFVTLISAGAALGTQGGNAAEETVDRIPLPASQGAPEPDLGTHWKLFEPLSAECTPDLSYLNERYTEHGAWADQARALLLDKLSYAPAPCAPDPELVESTDCGSYTRERILINTTPHLRIPVYVLVPKNLSRPAPGIVALHDHGGFYFWGKEKVVDVAPEHPALIKFKKKAYAGRSIADELAKRGNVVIASDMIHWGERAMYFANDPERILQRTVDVTDEDLREFNARSWAHEELLGRTALTCGATCSGIITLDDRRVADYLGARPEVDSERMGCLGLSVGSVRTLFLGALRPKIRASVAVCWMSEYQPMTRNHIRNGIGFTKLVPGLYGHLDWPDLGGLHLPGALMTISGLQDALFPVEAMRGAVAKIEGIFAKAGLPEKYEGLFFDGPHEFNAAMQEKAFDWLEKQLA